MSDTLLDKTITECDMDDLVFYYISQMFIIFTGFYCIRSLFINWLFIHVMRYLLVKIAPKMDQIEFKDLISIDILWLIWYEPIPC